MAYRVVGSAVKGFSLGDFDQWMDIKWREEQGENMDGYSTVAWVYRCLNLRCNALAGVPFRISRKGKDETEVDWPITMRPLIWKTQAALLNSGANYLLKRYNRMTLKDLQWLNPNSMTNIATAEQGITGYKQKVGPKERIYKLDEIAYTAYWNPNDDTAKGIAPMQVLRTDAGMAAAISTWSSLFFKNGAIPAVVFSTEMRLPPGEAESIESKWNSILQGVRNAWKTITLQGGLKPIILTPPVKDLAMVELSTETRNKICNAFGIPITMLDDAANYATAESHRMSFYQDVVIPDGLAIQESWNEQIFYPMGLEFEFDPDQLDIMQEDEAARATSLNALVNAGVPLVIAMEVLGYDLTEEQWAEIKAEIARKQKEAEEISNQAQGVDVPGKDEKPLNVERKQEDEQPPSASKAAFDDLRKWQSKIRRRGKFCDFESEHFGSGVKALLQQRFEDDAGTAWDFLKARPDNADATEKRLKKAILAVLALALPIIVAAIEAGEEPDMAEFENSLRLAIESQLVRTVTEEALRTSVEVGIDLGVAEVHAAALEWAHGYSFELIKGITDRTRTVVSDAVQTYVSTPGMTNAQLTELLAPSFGEKRAELIGITEVTRAYSEATLIQQQQYAAMGIETEPIWNTANDEKVCLICGPLNSKPMRDWKVTFPHGPGAHPGCRCWLTLQVIV